MGYGDDGLAVGVPQDGLELADQIDDDLGLPRTERGEDEGAEADRWPALAHAGTGSRAFLGVRSDGPSIVMVWQR